MQIYRMKGKEMKILTFFLCTSDDHKSSHSQKKIDTDFSE